MRRLFFYCLSIAFLAIHMVWPTTASADSLILHATVPALPEHFQLALSGPANDAEFASGTILTYTLTYGSYLSVPTDIMVLEISWSQGQIPGGGLVNLIQYDSADQAIGNTTATIDYANRKVTWTISPVPPGDNHQVDLNLKLISNYQGDELIPLSISARLIGPGVELPTQVKTLKYHYVAPSATLTPTPTASTTSTPTPTPDQSSPSAIPLIPPIGQITPTPIGGRTTPTPAHQPSGSQSPFQEFIDTIDLPQIGQTTADKGGAAAAVPAALILLVGPLLSLILQLAPYASWWQLPSLLGAFFLSRKRRSWGVVYDSITKLPLDPVLVTLTDARGKSYQSITDIYGRYQFLVVPGRYRLKVQKTNYTFPSTHLVGQSDPVYEDVYFGHELVIDDATNINVNIPMDPVNPDWNQQAKATLGLAHAPHLNFHWRAIIFGVGFMWCLSMAILSPNPVNLLMVGLYLAVMLGTYLYHHNHPWGVIEESHQPLANAIVTIEDLDQPQIKYSPVVTNATGRYAFLVEGGDYRLKVALPQEKQQFSEYLTGPTIHVGSQYGAIHQDLQIEEAKPYQPA